MAIQLPRSLVPPKPLTCRGRKEDVPVRVDRGLVRDVPALVRLPALDVTDRARVTPAALAQVVSDSENERIWDHVGQAKPYCQIHASGGFCATACVGCDRARACDACSTGTGGLRSGCINSYAERIWNHSELGETLSLYHQIHAPGGTGSTASAERDMTDRSCATPRW